MDLNQRVRGDSLQDVLNDMYKHLVDYVEVKGRNLPYSFIAARYTRRCRKFNISIKELAALDSRFSIEMNDSGTGYIVRGDGPEIYEALERFEKRQARVSKMIPSA